MGGKEDCNRIRCFRRGPGRAAYTSGVYIQTVLINYPQQESFWPWIPMWVMNSFAGEGSTLLSPWLAFPLGIDKAIRMFELTADRARDYFKIPNNEMIYHRSSGSGSDEPDYFNKYQ